MFLEGSQEFRFFSDFTGIFRRNSCGQEFLWAGIPVFTQDKPIGASPGRDYEDGISTKNLVLNILWCRVGNYIEKGGERSAGYGLIERF